MITELPAADRIAVPWKNGGGVTCEVAAFPPGVGMDGFDWRVSMAEVAEAGPFSNFDGIDRHLTVLRGQLQLDVPDGRYTLFPLESLEFEGDMPVFGTPRTERVLDLNVMTLRGKVTAEVRQVAGHAEITADSAVLIELATLDALLIENAPGPIAVPAPSILIEFFQV